MIAMGEAGAACGHGAYAAAVRCPVVVACAQFTNWPEQRHVGMGDMERALIHGEIDFKMLGRDKWPVENGLVILEWEGPWPPRARPCFRHWVAFREGMIWDSNLEEWKSRSEWEQFLPDLMPKRSTGWHIARAYEVEPVNP